MTIFKIQSVWLLALLMLGGAPAQAAPPMDAGPPGAKQARGLRQLGRELAQMDATASAARPDRQALAAHKRQRRREQRVALLASTSLEELAETRPLLMQDSAADMHHAALLEYFMQQQIYGRAIGVGARAGRVHLLAAAATLGWVPTVSCAYGTRSQVDGGIIQVDAPEGRRALARAYGSVLSASAPSAIRQDKIFAEVLEEVHESCVEPRGGEPIDL